MVWGTASTPLYLLFGFAITLTLDIIFKHLEKSLLLCIQMSLAGRQYVFAWRSLYAERATKRGKVTPLYLAKVTLRWVIWVILCHLVHHLTHKVIKSIVYSFFFLREEGTIVYSKKFFSNASSRCILFVFVSGGHWGIFYSLSDGGGDSP